MGASRQWQIAEGERPTERELEWLTAGIYLGMMVSGNQSGAKLVAERFTNGDFDAAIKAK